MDTAKSECCKKNACTASLKKPCALSSQATEPHRHWHKAVAEVLGACGNSQPQENKQTQKHIGYTESGTSGISGGVAYWLYSTVYQILVVYKSCITPPRQGTRPKSKLAGKENHSAPQSQRFMVYTALPESPSFGYMLVDSSSLAQFCCTRHYGPRNLIQ